MNVKLSFAPLSRSSLDLLAVVLDEGSTLHAIDDALVASHVERAAAGFRGKNRRRGDYATPPEGSPAKSLVVYWSPQIKSYNLWENVKTFTARALRLARDYHLPHIGLLLNRA